MLHFSAIMKWKAASKSNIEKYIILILLEKNGD